MAGIMYQTGYDAQRHTDATFGCYLAIAIALIASIALGITIGTGGRDA